MANFFSLQDGNLTDASVYGYSLTGAEVMNNTTGTNIGTNSVYSPYFLSDSASISSMAVHLSSRSANPTGTFSVNANLISNLTETTFVDTTNNSIITNNNSVYTTTDTPFAPNMCGSFSDANNTYIAIPSNSATALRANNFTIEFWYLNYDADGAILRPIYTNYTTWGANSILIEKSTNKKMQLMLGTYSTTIPIISDPNVMTSGWNHWAVTRNNNTYTIYKNGSSLSAYTHGITISASGATNVGYIGAYGSALNSYVANGTISNFRIINGNCLYTSNFTPSTAPLTNISNTALLTLQNGVPKDNSSNNFVLTASKVKFLNFSPLSASPTYSPDVHGGSAYIPLSSSLQVPSSSYTRVTTNPFTLEFWFRSKSILDNTLLFSNQNSTGNGLHIIANTDNWINGGGGGTTFSGTTASDTFGPGVTNYGGSPGGVTGSYWIPRQNNYIQIPKTLMDFDTQANWRIQFWVYLNGFPSSLNQYIFSAKRSGTSGGMFLDALVIGGGPSSRPLEFSVGNNAGNGRAVNNANVGSINLQTWTHVCITRSTITNAGDTITFYLNGGQTYTASTLGTNIGGSEDWFFGLASSNDLTYGGNGNIYISNFNYTRSSLGPDTGVPIFPNNPAAVFALTSPYDNTISYYSTKSNGAIKVYRGNILIHTANTMNYMDNSWHHLALTRNSNGSNLFIDGIQQGTTNANQSATNFDDPSPTLWSIGKPLVTANGSDVFNYNYYNGYVSNFRAITGTALYTATFTPSTTPLTNITNTRVLLNTNILTQSYNSNLGTYAVSSFTSYDGSNNLLTPYPQNWQILKFNNALTSLSTNTILVDVETSDTNQLSLVGMPLTAKDISRSNIQPYFVGSSYLTSFKPYDNFDDSIYVNGSSNYLTVPANSAFDFGAKEFTMECWFNMVSSETTYGTIFGIWSSEFSFLLMVQSNILKFQGNNTLFITGPTISYNTWYHVAIVRTNSLISMYVNGILISTPYNIINNALGSSTENLLIGKTSAANSGMIGYINNLRITNGSSVYTTNFVPSTNPLTFVPSTVFLLKTGANYDKALIGVNTLLTPISSDNIHIGSSLNGLSVEPRTITASTSTFNNLYIHNQGTLNFPLISSKTLTLNGSAGLQITSDGTLNIGTNSSVIPSSTTHTVVLSNTQIDVHNGGNLNVYGYPKSFTTNLVSDYQAGTNTFTTTDSISSIWNVGDVLTFKPNLTARTGFDTLTIASFTGSNTLSTTSNSLFMHMGSATYANIAGVYNLNRNVIIRGLNTTQRGTIRTIDAAKTSVNYAQLSNFGINSSNKTGFIFGNSINGSTTLSGIVINSDNISTINTISPLTGRTFQNATINNNIINKTNITAVSSLSVNNVNINNNFILSSSSIGLQISNLSGSISMSNNTTIGSLSYGTYLANNTLTGTYGANNFNSGLQGMMVSGTNTGTIVGGGLNSVKEGVYVDASTSTLSGVTFQNILANNNSSVGFKVSGNNLNYLTPVVLNINGMTASTNTNAGFEAYNITGNLSSIISNNNLSASRISIGNGPTIFDGISSTLSGNCLNILSATNYNQTVIKNALLSSLSINSIALNISNVNKFEEFRIEGSTLSATTPLQISSSRSKLEGSYMFVNSNSNTYGLSSLALTGYQSDVFLETGFSVMNENGLSSNKYRMLAAGRISLDSVVVHTVSNTASEKLEPMSIDTKLRSGSKYIALNAGNSVIVNVYVKKSTSYTGTSPRLMLKGNSNLGYTDKVLSTSIAANGNWENMMGSLGIASKSGIVEVYVDCSGSVGCGSINIDDWDFS